MMLRAEVATPVRDQTSSARTARRGETHRPAFGWSLIALALLLVLNSLVGPLVLGVADYPISASMTNQLLGLEVVTLALVVPWMAIAGALALRDDPRAPLLALGPAGYTAYMFVQYVVGPEYAAYSWMVLFHVAVVAFAGGVALTAWSRAQNEPVPALTVRQLRWMGVVVLGLAAFVLLRYLPAFAGAVSGEPIEAEFADARTFFWSIVLLDLGVVVPLTVAAGVGLLRNTKDGQRALYGIVGWFALVPPSVTAMAAVMLARDDPHASVGTLVVLSVATLVFWAVAGSVFATLRGVERPQAGLDPA
jgi:hypothetical protein